MLKRTFDIVAAGTAILLLAPLLVPIMILLRLTGEGKIFYKQQRVGRGGNNFGLYKFATMLENSPNLPGGDVTSANDPRVLPMGRLLRKTKINELPQLLNILRGDMSVVGPRPMTPRNFAYYPEEVQREIKDLQPGLTGIGSIVFRDEEQILAKSTKPHLECFREDIAPYKGALEVWYKQHRSFELDMLLILLTVWAVIFPRSTLHFRLFKDLPRNAALTGVAVS
jgi:lipopolysaccharide/colanic/teichoic acid biosynthesis glycosyltransferase